MSWAWDDQHVVAMDYETSGTLPEYALQPWRMASDMWVTSMAWVYPDYGPLKHDGMIGHSPYATKRFLEWAIEEDRVVCGWNTPFDISVAMAQGFTALCKRVHWLDGRLLWRHVFCRPETDDSKPRKPYGLKDYVREHMPQFAGYDADVDFHDQSAAALEKLHRYNVQDCAFTLMGCKALWAQLEPRQQQAAWIEAQCLPMVAEANLTGLLIDTLAANDLILALEATAADKLSLLAPYGVTEKVVRSPKQMATLLFDEWKLPVQSLTATGGRSTDKTTLFELAFIDERCKTLRDYREALNCSKKFAQTPLAAAQYNGDNRAHPMAMVFGTYSGRFTYSSKQNNRKKRKDGEEAFSSEGA
jgi:DNA polymerase I-like protein with 3'-5' exonuclease and polymerase domains